MTHASPYAVVEQPVFSWAQFPSITTIPYLSRGREGSERGKTHLSPREHGFRVSPLVYPSVGMGLYRGQWTPAKAPPSRITVFAHALLPVPRRLAPHSYRLGLGRFPRSLSTQLRRHLQRHYLCPVDGFGWVLSPTWRMTNFGSCSMLQTKKPLTAASGSCPPNNGGRRMSKWPSPVDSYDNGFSVSRKKGPTQVAGPNHFNKENNPNEKGCPTIVCPTHHRRKH